MNERDESHFIDQIVSGVGAAEERMRTVEQAKKNGAAWLEKVERFIKATGSFSAGLAYQRHERALTIKSGNAPDHNLVVRAIGSELTVVKQSKDGEEKRLASALINDGHNMSVLFKRLSEELKYLHTGGEWV